MFETYTTVIGTVVSDPQRRTTSSGVEVISFRMASNSRRMNRATQEWIDGPTLYLRVSCWRRLVDAVDGAVAKGRPVIVHGQISTNSYVTADGERRSDLEMTADTVGLDLNRCVVEYRGWSRRAESGASDGAASTDSSVDAATDTATTDSTPSTGEPHETAA
ncbi:hypothetical protein GCM10009624_07950 [Gordonia sinesedis]